MTKAFRWLIILLVTACVAAWALVQLLRGGQDASGVSSIVSMVLTAVSLVFALAGWELTKRTVPQRVDALQHARSAAETLAKRLLAAEEKQLRALVGKDEELLNVTFTRRPYDGSSGEGPERGQIARTSPAASGALPDIVTYYRSCTKPRLVITGAPGAGKTVLSVALMRGLIKGRTPDDPLPVRVSLAEWDMNDSFDKLLIGHLIKAGTSEERAIWLMQNKLVLPILDGLDEMDPGRTDANRNPLYGPDGQQLPDDRAPRARAALQVLSNYGEMVSEFPLILLCRTSHYDALPSHERLQHAVGVEIDPIGHERIAEHRTTVFKGEARWLAFVHDLPAHAVLRRTLTTPWWLFLLKAVYHRRGDPSELFGCPTEQAMKDRLLSLFIPAVIDLHPAPYDPARVKHWLGVIARHLRSGPHAGERVDIHRHRLWPIAGTSRVRYCDSVAAAALFLALALPLLLVRESPATWLFAGVGIGVVMVIWDVSRQAGDWPPCVPWGRMFSGATLNLFIQTLPVALVLSALGGLLVLPVAWLADAFGLASLASFLPALGVFWSVLMGVAIVTGHGITHTYSGSHPPDVNTAVRWRYVLRGDLLLGCATFVAAGVSIVVSRWVMSFSNELVLSSVRVPDVVTFGLLAAALRWVTVFGGGRRYLVFLLCLRGQLPRRLGRFLRWSHEGGLLRTSGGAYQFRHRELQQWLDAG